MDTWNKIKTWVSKRSGGTISIKNETSLEKWRKIKDWVDSYSIHTCRSDDTDNVFVANNMEEDNINPDSRYLGKQKVCTNMDPVWNKRIEPHKIVITNEMKTVRRQPNKKMFEEIRWQATPSNGLVYTKKIEK